MSKFTTLDKLYDAEFPPRVKTKPIRDPNKIASRLAEAYEEEKRATHKLRRAHTRWDSAVRTRERLEKEMDKAAVAAAEE